MNNTFITYEQALSIIGKNTGNFSTEPRKLEDCIGTYLAEDLIADRDFPPFDRVTMDGIAIAYDTFKNGNRTFPIAAIAAAGTPQLTLNNALNCIEVMTGAILPKAVDTVIRYEDLELSEGAATIKVDTLRYKQNVHFKGMDIAKGTVIVHKGIRLSSAEINIAASIGKSTLNVRKMPKVVIFSTGDELVPVHKIPEPHQIRTSNVYGIQATLKEWGVSADVYHLADNKEEMLSTISEMLLAYDLLVFTGGVSKGKFDYLPQVLEELKVEQHFHKIQQRPGKPFWFGTNAAGKKIFALPGNPVSSFVCTYIYLKHWFDISLRLPSVKIYAELDQDVHFKPDLVYFLQAKLKNLPNGKQVATPIRGNGSGDFTTLTKTDGFLVLPQGRLVFKKGEVYEFIKFRIQS